MSYDLHITDFDRQISLAVQATVRTLRDLSRLVANEIIILAQERPDGELLRICFAPEDGTKLSLPERPDFN